MKQPLKLEPWLKEFHWEDLADLHMNLGYCRHRFIQTVNEKLSSQTGASLEALDQLAKVDDLLKAAGDTLERAKTVLFDLCYDCEPPAGENEKSKN